MGGREGGERGIEVEGAVGTDRGSRYVTLEDLQFMNMEVTRPSALLLALVVCFLPVRNTHCTLKH